MPTDYQQDRSEPYRQQLLARTCEELDSRTWAERNADALTAHGKDIAMTGLAGAEFEQI